MSQPADSLRVYRGKRNFTQTKEPDGAPATAPTHTFVVQKHAATRLHYDLRLELGGVLKSWAVPRGPSLDPSQKRLAVEVEDHPIGYAEFEGSIPPGNYGAGTVIVWDRGHWTPLIPGSDPEHDLVAGMLKFQVEAQRMTGAWVLIRMKPRPGEKQPNWLLIKEHDAAARPGSGAALLDADTSVISGRTVEEVALERGAGEKAAAGKRDVAPPEHRPVEVIGVEATRDRVRGRLHTSRLDETRA